MRVSIRKHNQAYLARVSAQMEVDPSETVNYLLTELRRIGYSFNSNVSLAIGGGGGAHTGESDLETQELGTTGSLMAAVAKDPVIERILTAGLEVF